MFDLTQQPMLNAGTQALALGAALSAAAAAAHLACIAIGPPAYLFMGAGEKMARAVEAGRLRPTVVTLAITGLLLVWATYALSGAGLIVRLPFTKLALLGICTVFIGRAVAFPLLQPLFPENSQTFWLVSSGICLLMGLVHLFGLVSLWPEL